MVGVECRRFCRGHMTFVLATVATCCTISAYCDGPHAPVHTSYSGVGGPGGTPSRIPPRRLLKGEVIRLHGLCDDDPSSSCPESCPESSCFRMFSDPPVEWPLYMDVLRGGSPESMSSVPSVRRHNISEKSHLLKKKIHFFIKGILASQTCCMKNIPDSHTSRTNIAKKTPMTLIFEDAC